jgi:hypothetical protein
MQLVAESRSVGFQLPSGKPARRDSDGILQIGVPADHDDHYGMDLRHLVQATCMMTSELNESGPTS